MDRRRLMRTIVAVVVAWAVGVADSEAADRKSSKDPEVLARAIIEEGAVRSAVEQIVASFRRLAVRRVQENVDVLEARVAELEGERREKLEKELGALPDRFESDLDEFLSSVDFDELALDLFVPVYVERFDVKELQAVLRFYESPAGRAFARENNSIQAAGAQALATRLEPTLGNFMRQWIDEEFAGLGSMPAADGEAP